MPGNAAIDPYVLPGDVARAVGSQKGDDIGDFFGLTIAFHGDAFTELLRPFGVAELVRSGKILMARGGLVT